MPIRKMKMQLIDNEKTRMHTFDRRKKCLFNKAYELSVLCDVEVCVVVGSCLSVNQRNAQWKTWPKNLSEVERIIRKFEVKKSSKTMANVSTVLIPRQENAGEKSDFPLWDSRIDCFSFERLRDLLEVLDKKLAAVDARMTALQTTQVNELPIIDFSDEEEEITNKNFTLHGLQTDQSQMDWIDYLDLDISFLPHANNELFDDLPTEPSNETLPSEEFYSLPEPDNHSMAINLPTEPLSEMGPMQPDFTMDYYSITVGEPSQWSSLPPLDPIASRPDFTLNNYGCILNQNQHIPIKSEPEKSVEQPEHDGYMEQNGYYSTEVNAPTQPSELLPLPYTAFLSPADICRPGFCGGDYYYPTNNWEEDLFLRFNDTGNCQWD